MQISLAREHHEGQREQQDAINHDHEKSNAFEVFHRENPPENKCHILTPTQIIRLDTMPA